MAMSEKSTVANQQVRLVMWTVPRSLSTVLTKCLSFIDDSKIFMEPFSCAHHLGPDARIPVESQTDLSEVPAVTTGFETSQCTYKWVKEQLEEPRTAKKFIFCKDMAYSITDRLDFLPKGYRHVFLIRHPLKVFPSWKNVLRLAMTGPPDAFRLEEAPSSLLPSGYGYKEISDLLDHVREAYDQDAIIVDADDLLQDPRGTLSALFKAIGLPFHEKILHWEAGDAITHTWIASNHLLRANKTFGFYKGALDSTCFLKPRPPPDRSSLSSDILHCVDASIPYYEKMYAQRLTAN